MRALAVVAAALALPACGSSGPAAVPEALLGGYQVNISSAGRTDPDHLTIAAGSGGSLVLDFVAGLSAVRARLDGSRLTLPRQRLTVSRASGPLDASATGSGTLTAATTASPAAIDLTLQIAAFPGSGESAADGGSGSAFELHVVGLKQ